MANSFKPSDAYAAGLMGCKPSPKSDEVFADYIIRHGGNPVGELPLVRHLGADGAATPSAPRWRTSGSSPTPARGS
jgi:hypothetical protein